MKDLETTGPIIRVRNLKRDFRVGSRGKGKGVLRAVNDASFDVMPGETLGVVGESGSGKSTIGRMLVGLLPATGGEIELFGETITGSHGKRALAKVRHRLQFVFQDPHAAMNPRMRISDVIAEPIDIQGGWSRKDRADRVAELLELVGLSASFADRFPHEFSGGQRQRIVIARALALDPDFIVCDEAVAALDVSMQAQVINLLMDLQDRLGLSYLFIAHDLAVVRAVSTRIAVLYAGEIVELAEKRELYENPKHPYTQALLAAIPRPEVSSRKPPIRGEVPSILDRPDGCTLCPRCPMAFDRCRTAAPALREVAPGHRVACHLYDGD
ncbi:ABC transporter ATP-binding protein [Pukyongiella litopenaei]|uniref:ABC transporter ATP-binding protein n=1 Tax=Pukyongiella litopenaei TaxID=2605946 RepID=A0A2S0MR97_9RHOB|nr:ABC transporter ATP-binding protein [Pukyongiella litopenaei]AVO38281.1 ABC transporter ATP-binding protein [Pukyongiella litopenaei]